MRILLAAVFLLIGILTLEASSPAVSWQAVTVPVATGLAPHEADQTTASAAHSDCEDGCLLCENCSNCMTSHSGVTAIALAVSLYAPAAEGFSVPKHYTQRSLAGYSGPYRPPRT
jgi:hypothetical protein